MVFYGVDLSTDRELLTQLPKGNAYYSAVLFNNATVVGFAEHGAGGTWSIIKEKNTAETVGYGSMVFLVD